jgi:molybdenum cofactor cytidylyltransferase
MGSPKQLIDIGGKTMLEAMVAVCASAELDGIAVVTHADVRAALANYLPAGVLVVANDDPDTEMIDSVRLGIAAWQRERNLIPADGFLVCPADHPGLAVDDVRRCVRSFRENPARVVIATRAGKHGHPLIFPIEFAEFVLSPACDSGLFNLHHSHADRVLDVACTSPGVLQDVDTPDDLHNL